MLTIPTLRLPAFVAAVGRRLPQWPHSFALATALNTAIRLRVIDAGELSVLEGKVVRIRVTDAGSCASISMRGGRFRAASVGAPSDLCVAAPATAFLQMLTRQQDPDTLFFNRALSIEGDTELGLIVKNLLDRIELPAFMVLGGKGTSG